MSDLRPISQALDPQAIIFNQRASSFDSLSWVTNVDFLGSILSAISHFAEQYRLQNRLITRYLDVGTGTGEVLKYLSEDYPNTQGILSNAVGVGIDISSQMLEIARQKLSNNSRIELYCTSIMHHNLKYQSYDFIICRNSFHHFNNPEVALIEMKRLVRSNGRIFIIEGVAPDNQSLLKWQEILLLRDIGRNPSILLSLENVQSFFEDKFHLRAKVTELTTVPMLVSNWLDNALLTNDTRQEIISKTAKLYKDEQFRSQFGLVQIKKEPVYAKDYAFKKRSVLIELTP